MKRSALPRSSKPLARGNKLNFSRPRKLTPAEADATAGKVIDVDLLSRDAIAEIANQLSRRKRINPRRAKPRPGDLPPEEYRVLAAQVMERDGHRCRNCRCTANTAWPALAAHHIIFRSQGGPDTAENLITICGQCHNAIHERRLFIEGDALTARFTTSNPRRTS